MDEVTLRQEQRFEMTLVEVVSYVATDRLFAFNQHIQIPIAHFGRDLVTHVQ